MGRTSVPRNEQDGGAMKLPFSQISARQKVKMNGPHFPPIRPHGIATMNTGWLEATKYDRTYSAGCRTATSMTYDILEEIVS